jgi:hypothetical protein
MIAGEAEGIPPLKKYIQILPGFLLEWLLWLHISMIEDFTWDYILILVIKPVEAVDPGVGAIIFKMRIPLLVGGRIW